MLVLRKYYLLFMALEALAINYYLFFNNWISWIILGLLTVKIIGFGKVNLLIGGIVFGLFWGVYQNNKITNLIHHFDQYHVKEHPYIVYSDQIHFKKNMISFEANDCVDHHRVKCIYYCKNGNDIQKLKEISGKLVISVNANVKMEDAPTNENQFNYSNFLYSRNVSHIVKISHFTKISTEKMNSFKDWGHLIRQRCVHWLEDLPYPLKGYGKSLILGISDSDFQNTIDNVHKLGLTYLFCLSGMHVLFICKYLNAILNCFHIPIELSNILLLVGLPFYLIIGGNGLSLSRAIWMTWLGVCSSLILKNKLDGIECWSLVLIFSLLNYPLSFLSLGSVMSYLMTFIILLCETNSTGKISLKLNNYSIPWILNNTYQYNLLTSVLSVVYGIIFEKIIFPITVIGVCIPFLSSYCNQIIRINDWIFNQLFTIPTTVTFGKLPFVSALGITIVMFMLENKQRRIFKLSLIGTIYFFSWIYLFFPMTTNVIYFDIGQGDSILVQKAFSHRVSLIDTGGKLDFGKYNNRGYPTEGQKIIANYLLSKGITTVNELYLTHQDMDHIGYMASIGNQVNYDKIFVPSGMEKLKSFQKKLQKLRKFNYKIIPVTNRSLGTTFQILYPFKSGSGKNEDSLVLYFKVEGYRFLFMGDLDQAGEMKLIEHYPELKADILKAGHHGSKTSSNPKFIKQINPKLVVISSGRNNRYGHPHIQTINTLSSQKIPFVNTADDGMIKVKIDNFKVNIIRWLKEKDVIEFKRAN